MVDGAQEDRFAADVWSARNQLIAISGGVSANFQYDAFGRRVSKTVAGTTQYLYDGVNPVQELSGTSVSANLLTGLGVDEYFQRTDASGPANFLTDALGSTVALTGASGATLASYIYEPFGNTIVSGSSSSPYQFTARENDSDGLYYYRARYFSPTLQRFFSEDRLFPAAGTNAFRYAYDSPPNSGDPTGLWPIDWGRTASVNRCAGQLSQSISLNPAPGNFWADALLGNQFGTISQAILGPGRKDAAAQLIVDNPVPKASANGLLQTLVGLIPTGSQVYVPNGNLVLGPWGPAFDTSPTAVTVGDTFAGGTLLGALGLFEAGKLVVDAGVYLGALAVCSEQ